VAPLITGGIVTSLEILGAGTGAGTGAGAGASATANQEMGDRGSKSDSNLSVKEQRVDGFSVKKKIL